MKRGKNRKHSSNSGISATSKDGASGKGPSAKHGSGAGIERTLHDPISDNLIPVYPLDLSKVSEASIRRWTDSGLLPARRVGRRRARRLREEDLRSFMEAGPGHGASAEDPGPPSTIVIQNVIVSQGDHLAAFYTTDAGRLRIGLPFLRDGLRAGETVSFIVNGKYRTSLRQVGGCERDLTALLDELESDLERVWGGAPRNPLIARLPPTVSACDLQIEPFRKLIEANRRDQSVDRYDTYGDLLGYCELSANPIGELVLGIFGVATPERRALSDKVCSALQLTEHWQDVGEDYARGRIYLPLEDMRRFGVPEADLGASAASPALRSLIEFEVRRARELLDEGAPLVRTLSGRPKLAVAAFVAGGRSALQAIDRAGYEVLGSPPRAGRTQRVLEAVRTLISG